jgi:hypothetical protein
VDELFNQVAHRPARAEAALLQECVDLGRDVQVDPLREPGGVKTPGAVAHGRGEKWLMQILHKPRRAVVGLMRSQPNGRGDAAEALPDGSAVPPLRSLRPRGAGRRAQPCCERSGPDQPIEAAVSAQASAGLDLWSCIEDAAAPTSRISGWRFARSLAFWLRWRSSLRRRGCC